MELPKLWAHQDAAITFAKTNPDVALFYDTGTGKTRTIIEILRYRFNHAKKIQTTLIVCPLIVCENWRSEIKKYSKIPPQKVVVLTGPIKSRISKMESLQGHIVITNYEAFASDEFSQAVYVKLLPELLVCDESHRVKNPTATRTKRLVKLSLLMEERKAQGVPIHRYILSGSPILNNQMDIFSQFLILDAGKTFGKNFFVFRNQYFFNKNANMPKHVQFPDWQIRREKEAEMSVLVGRKSLQAKKSECLDLPELIRQEIDVPMSKEQQRAYNDMKKDFITFVETGVCTAQLAITKSLRMQQCLSGFLKLEDGTIHRFDDNPRAKALSELLEDLAPYHKILVWSVFKENYDQIRTVCEKLKLPYVEVHGDVPNKEKYAAVDRFNSDPTVRVFIGHPGSGGIGINLVAASYSIFYNRNFSREQDIQAEARNHRGGSEIHDKITRIDLVSKGTLDELILEALAEKQNIAEKILANKYRL